jgi:hypothetical protein
MLKKPLGFLLVSKLSFVWLEVRVFCTAFPMLQLDEWN